MPVDDHERRIRARGHARRGRPGDREAESFRPIEEAVEAAAWSSRLYYVGRLRTQGYWQLVFYGARDREQALAALARLATGRVVETGTKVDPEWRYYRELLMPDAEAIRSTSRAASITGCTSPGFVVAAIDAGLALEGTSDAARHHASRYITVSPHACRASRGPRRGHVGEISARDVLPGERVTVRWTVTPRASRPLVPPRRARSRLPTVQRSTRAPSSPIFGFGFGSDPKRSCGSETERARRAPDGRRHDALHGATSRGVLAA